MGFLVQKSVVQGKQIVQALSTGAKHFVTIHFSAHKLTLFDSLGVRLTKTLREQIPQLFFVEGRAPKIEMPKLQKKACGSNNCAVFAAAYVADICHGSPVTGAIYVDSQQQRS